MINQKRFDELLNLINEDGYASVASLAERTYASPSTIRRDLIELERLGYVKRYHGGAELAAKDLRLPMNLRMQKNHEAKSAIARKAVEKITDGNIIFLDNSSSAQHMVPYLSRIKDITVFTNGAETTVMLGKANIRVYCTGGLLFTKSLAYIGEYALAMVRQINFDYMFFSSYGLDGDLITDWCELETQLRRAVIAQSRYKYFLCDRSKYGLRSIYNVCTVREISSVISE